MPRFNRREQRRRSTRCRDISQCRAAAAGCHRYAFPLYILFFWNDVVLAANTAKQRIVEQSPFAIRISLGIQWIAISICVAAPVMLSIASAVVWFTRMKR